MAADSSGDGAPHEEALGGPAPDAPWEAPTVSVRDAVGADVDAIRDFGHAHIRAHYAPLIGPAAAEAQVTEWWSEHRIRAAVAAGRTVVAHAGGRLVGVGERGVAGADHAIYKLYVHPELRGRAVGPRLIDALTDQLPMGRSACQSRRSPRTSGRSPSTGGRDSESSAPYAAAAVERR